LTHAEIPTNRSEYNNYAYFFLSR